MTDLTDLGRLLGENAKPLAVRPKKAAEMLAVSRSKVYQMVKDGKLESRKIDGCTLVLVSSIEAHLA